MSHIPNPLVIFSTGALLLVATMLFGWVLIPKFIQDQISNQVKLRNGTEIWDKWISPPIPIYFKVYLFNVTNPQEIASGSLPKFLEVGPYVYREYREKIEIQENITEGIVRYKEKVTYFFLPEESSGLLEDDELTILNIPYVAAAQKVSELSYPFNSLALTYIIKFKQTPFIKKKVKDILFDGWKVPMAAELSEYLGQDLLPNNTFGLFYGKNGTDDGWLEVDAGITSIDNFGKILSWRGQKELSWWKKDSHCNQLRGTDGSIFSPFVNKKRVIHIFNADLCRSLSLTFQKEVNFLGISAYRFTAPKEMLEDPRTNVDNQCYCTSDEVEDCLHGGAMSLETCRDGAPVAMTLPHFLDGYQGYRNQSGLTPDSEKHGTVLDIEPTTGIVLHAHKRIQVNVLLKPVDAIRSLSKMPEMIFPVVWADETAEIDEELAQQLKSQLLTPLITLEITKWAVLGISLLLIFSACVRWFTRPKQETEQDTECTDRMLNGGERGRIIINAKKGIVISGDDKLRNAKQGLQSQETMIDRLKMPEKH